MRYRHEEDDWRKGEITKILPFRSYEVLTDDGSRRRRTSRHVRLSRESPIVMNDNSDNISHSSSSIHHTSSSISCSDNSAREPSIQKNPHYQHAQGEQTINDTCSPSNENYEQYRTRSGRAVKLPARYR